MSVKIDICGPCTYAHDHGEWGDTLPKGAGTHCRTCHVSWPGTQTWGHCAKCHLTFRGVRAFDKHQQASGCPESEEDVATLLKRLRLVLMGKGKHCLAPDTHPKLGFEYWSWV